MNLFPMVLLTGMAMKKVLVVELILFLRVGSLRRKCLHLKSMNLGGILDEWHEDYE